MFFTAGLYQSTSALSVMKVTGFQVLLRTGVSRNFRQFLLFSNLIHLAVLISSHFFVIYMLQDLQLVS